MAKIVSAMFAALAVGASLWSIAPSVLAQNEQDAARKHMEEGVRGVTPETTHAQDRAVAAEQEESAKEQGMKQHIEEGTAGVSPHALPGDRKRNGAGETMEEHMREGTQGVSPHVLPQDR